MNYGKNFEFYNPTKVKFGEGVLTQVGEELSKYGKKVLMLYDSGWIKDTPIYPTVVKSLKEANMELFELGGILPNPRSDKVNEAIKMCKELDIDIMLAIGGGSVIDTAKLASPGVYYDGDCWDFITGKAKMEKFLPIAVISTISGTGSEMDAYGIVSNIETHDKLPFFNQGLFPTVTFLDPTITYSVSPYQTACGAIDAFSHYLEVYFMRPNLPVLDRVMEGFMKSIIEYIPLVMKNPKDYDARANIMWASSWALNGFTYGPTQGVPFMCHWIEDEVSAKYDITHGLGLAIILPVYLEHNLNETSAKLYKELATNVFNIDPNLNAMDASYKMIEEMKNLFFNVCGLKPHLEEYGVTYDEATFKEMARIACRDGELDGYVHMTQNDVIEILKKSL